MSASTALTIAPVLPANAPNTAERMTIWPSLLVHWRAAMPEAISIPTIRITPASCRPSTIATTIRVESNKLSRFTRKPRRAGELGVKGDQLELLPEQSQYDK